MIRLFQTPVRRLRHWRNRLRNRRSSGGDQAGRILIVFANDCFGQPLNLDHVRPVPGVRLAGDPRMAARADAVVFHVPTLKLPLPEKQPGQLWIAWSMECGAHYPLLADPSFMARFDLTMTYRLDSDIPIPYLAGDYDGILDLLRRPAPVKPGGHLAAAVVSGRFDACGRTPYLSGLMARMPVHTYGRMGTHAMPVPDLGQLTKRAVLAAYKFNCAFENAITEDYVTEKFYDPLYAGCVPVYRGAPNVDRFAPGDECYIDAARFRSAAELADFLLELDRDDTAYRRFFAWKNRSLRPAFLDYLAFSTRGPGPLERLALAVKARR